MSFMRVVASALLLAAAGCAYSKETVPLDRQPIPIRVPNQQRLLAIAVDEAVEALDLMALKGKSVRVERAGVLPHSDADLLDYVQLQVEGKLARIGARVIDRPEPLVFVPGISGPALVAQKEEVPDYRVAIGISWAGVDSRDRVRTDEPLLTKQLGLLVGGPLAGYALFNSGESSANRSMIGGLVTFGAPAAALLWAKADRPFKHTFTLMGRARIVANARPTHGGDPFTTEGIGSSKLVVDDNSPEGYLLERAGGPVPMRR